MLAGRRTYQHKIGRLSLIIGELIRTHVLYKRPSCSVIHSKLDFHSASADPVEYCCSLWKLNKDGQRPEKPRWALSVLNVFASLNRIGGPGLRSLPPLDSPSRVYVNVGEDHKGRSKILALRYGGAVRAFLSTVRKCRCCMDERTKTVESCVDFLIAIGTC